MNIRKRVSIRYHLSSKKESGN